MFALSYGIATGLVYSTILYHAWLFFPGKEGFISGIVIAGFGIGGSIFIELSSNFINPDGLALAKKIVDPESGLLVEQIDVVAKNLPSAIKKITYVWAVIFIVAILLVFKGPTTNNNSVEDEKETKVDVVNECLW